MPSLHTVITGILALFLLAGCGNNMFGSSSPALILEADTSPNTRDLERSKPEGLLPDRENARHSGRSLPPQ